jgi:ribosome maturation factor RimP
MRNEAGDLRQLLEPVVGALGYELVGMERFSRRDGSLLRIYIDCEPGVTVADCERVSHQVSGVLDVEDPIRGHYILEVSSPGLDRPLFTPEHFRRFTGRIVKVELIQAVQGRRKLTGQIVSMEADTVVILEGDAEYRVSFDAIGKARLVPETL